MATYKETIKKGAIENKKFLRILKELRMFNPYFRCLEKYGHLETWKGGKKIAMPTLVMDAFCWGNDVTPLRYAWPPLFSLLEECDGIIRKNKKVPINELKKNARWGSIEGLTERQQNQ